MKYNKNFEDWFYYDETSPSCLRWKINIASGRNLNKLAACVDAIAGTKQTSGYWAVIKGGVSFQVHRIIARLKGLDLKPEQYVDHINGDRGDNRDCNLRLIEPRHNANNQKMLKTNTSGKTGVGWVKDNGKTYAHAFYYDAGKLHGKKWPVAKFGLLPAFNYACIWREEKLAILNTLGANYTERHGKMK